MSEIIHTISWPPTFIDFRLKFRIIGVWKLTVVGLEGKPYPARFIPPVACRLLLQALLRFVVSVLVDRAQLIILAGATYILSSERPQTSGPRPTVIEPTESSVSGPIVFDVALKFVLKAVE